MATRKRGGTSGELIAFALLNDLGFDVYEPLVDDHGLDGIIRLKTNTGQTQYVDFQVKSAKDSNPWAGVRQNRIAEQDGSYVCIFIRRAKGIVTSFYLSRAQVLALGSRYDLHNPNIPAALVQLLIEHQSLEGLYQKLLNDAAVEAVDVLSQVVLNSEVDLAVAAVAP